MSSGTPNPYQTAPSPQRRHFATIYTYASQVFSVHDGGMSKIHSHIEICRYVTARRPRSSPRRQCNPGRNVPGKFRGTYAPAPKILLLEFEVMVRCFLTLRGGHSTPKVVPTGSLTAVSLNAVMTSSSSGLEYSSNLDKVRSG